MRALPARLRRPRTILVISAHWEETVATAQAGASPPLFFDYHGFPEESYNIRYEAPGSPETAQRIVSLLGEHGLPARLDGERGFDHGLFIPLKLSYPEADIPCLQLSLVAGLDPAVHLEMGRALRPLLSEGVLIVGSGFSFHNMRAFSWRGARTEDPENDAFQNWLIETCAGGLARDTQEQRLVQWTEAPGARYCHPREEHLLPLHVCLGAATGSAEVVFDDAILGKRAVALLWG